MLRTRFAPSPTGELHIGGVRTALFAYLFAKSQKGEFLLRIEDTDRERYVEGAEKRIEDSLKWLGINWDNKKPMVQSERIEVYKKHAFDLVKAGHAYICTCSKEKLAKDRERQEKEGKPPRYEGYCRNEKFSLSDLKEGCYVVRMKMPENKKIKFNDLVRGEVLFDSSLIDDQVILKSDGYPTYHLASVVDDHEMGITHVIRAEEWLSSTPKHLVLYEMFGWKAPEFAHLSMILGSDKKKLSKRHGATSVIDYKNEGYLPEAIVNFLAFLGWNPKDDTQRYFLLKDLESAFNIEGVNKAPAIFDIEKLNNYNEFYIKAKQPNQLKELLTDFKVKDLTDGEAELLKRGGYGTLEQAAQEILNLRKKPEYNADLLVFKKSSKEKSLKGLEESILELESIEENPPAGEWSAQEIQMKLGLVATRNELNNGDVFWPVRVALSGEEKSPSPAELANALGKEETLKRIKSAINKMK